MDRDLLESYWEEPALAAELRMHEMEQQDRVWTCLLYSHVELLEILEWANQEHPQKYESVWARIMKSTAETPQGYRCIGYEPNYFPSGHFSPIADALCFPRWHGTDPEGVLFVDHFRRLNSRGLFNEVAEAEGFLHRYLSFPWTERGEFSIAEVWVPENSVEG